MTNEEFTGWWKALTAAIDPGTSVPRWSAAGRESPGSFVVTRIDEDCVRIEGPEHSIYQRIIGRSDFHRVLDIWQEYCRQQGPRHMIEDATKHSTYVISIIHWLESK